MKIAILGLLIYSFVFAETLSGIARNDKGDTVYSETHSIQRADDGHVLFLETIYVDAQGKKIARMVSDFKQSPFLPDCKFEDFRFDRVFDGKLQKTDLKSETYTISETQNGKLVKSSTVKVKDKMILGSGFNNFIFESMVKKQITNENIHFLVLAQHDYYSFDVKKIKSETGADDHYQIRPSSFLVKMFVKEIDIFYKPNSRKLARYKGLSNLPSDKDSAQDVTIDYGRGE